MTVASLQRGGPKLFLAAGTFNSCGGVDPAGRAAFRADASHRPTVILAADLDGDGTSEVLLGGSDNYVHLHGANGRRHWMHNVGGQVSGIVVADVNGDGKPEIIVATAELGYNLLVLDARGKRLWQAKAGEEINALAVGKIRDSGMWKSSSARTGRRYRSSMVAATARPKRACRGTSPGYRSVQVADRAKAKSLPPSRMGACYD